MPAENVGANNVRPYKLCRPISYRFITLQRNYVEKLSRFVIKYSDVSLHCMPPLSCAASATIYERNLHRYDEQT